jgi:hypothetical protein
MKIHYHASHAITMLDSAQPERKEVIATVVNELRSRHADLKRGQYGLRQALIGALAKYMHEICKTSDLSVLDRKTYLSRIESVKEIMRVVRTTNENDLVKQVSSLRNNLKEGFFSRSRLKKMLGNVLDSYQEFRRNPQNTH